MVLRERRLGVRCRGRSWFGRRSRSWFCCRSRSWFWSRSRCWFCCGSCCWFCCGSRCWSRGVWVIEGWREVCWRGLFGLLFFLFLFDFFLEGFFLFFGHGDIEDFLFGSAFVFGAQEFLGDFGFFFVDNFFDIASDEFEVGEFWGHEGRFGQDRLIDSGEFFAFIEQFAKFFVGGFAIDGLFEVFDEDRIGFDGCSAFEAGEVLPVLARWAQDGRREALSVGSFFVALATVCEA